jgi:outer membrane protein OmpA-like peptidoglycan-associated protein
MAKIGESGTFYLLLMPMALLGCATPGLVRERVAQLEGSRQSTLARLEAQLAALDDEIARRDEALRARAHELDALRSQALLASESVALAEEQARGRLLGETVFRVEGIRFEPASAVLTEASRDLLDQLAERLRMENAGYFLEVQASARESTGGGRLGAARAEAVRRYLHLDRGLPLHAMSTVTAPDGARGLAGEALERDPVLEPDLEDDPRVAVVVVRPFARP